MLRGWGGSGGGAGTESPRKLGCVIAAIRPLLGLFPAAAAAGPWKDRAGGLRARRSRETAAGGTGAGRERGGGVAGCPLRPPAMRRALHGTGVRRAGLGEPGGGRGGRKWALELGGRLGREKVGGRKCRWGV